MTTLSLKLRILKLMKLNPERTLMFLEAQSAAQKVDNQMLNNRSVIIDAVERMQQYNPHTIVTCARGSSDHAATFAKYIFESKLGLITSSASPSIGSIYQNNQKFKKVLYIAISQSGKSPDILKNVEYAKGNGALTLAFVNDEKSPLAQMVDICIPLRAGLEKSVAATKTYICTLSALLQFVAYWAHDKHMLYTLKNLPRQLKLAWQLNWSKAEKKLSKAEHLFVIGRGLGFGIVQEMALKFKETCGLHAEAYSAAEVKHGPMAIVKKDFPILLVAQNDASNGSVSKLLNLFEERGSNIISVGVEHDSLKRQLPKIADVQMFIEPLLYIQSFYRMVNSLAITRGYNPDMPPYLNKVTETI